MKREKEGKEKIGREEEKWGRKPYFCLLKFNWTMETWHCEKDLKVAANFRLTCPLLTASDRFFWDIFKTFRYLCIVREHTVSLCSIYKYTDSPSIANFSAFMGSYCRHFRTKKKKINTLGFWNLNLLDQKVSGVTWVTPSELDNLLRKNKLCLHEKSLKWRSS